MNIGIMHYHLKPGGVTTVINQHVRATRPWNDFLIISGESPPGDGPPAPTAVVPEIGYDHPDGRPACADPRAAAEALISRLRQNWDGGCDVLHIHNPLLAKNRRLLDIIRLLAAGGQRLLLQVHDFAEDGRPGSYYRGQDYPEDCHWAVINTRDRDLLIDAGARPEGVHYVANAVTPLPLPEVLPPPEPVMLYPVRAIRRKNIGEALLLSLFFKNRETLAVTLPPNNPADFPAYEGWKSFCAAGPAKVLFEASSRRPLAEWVGACQGMVTTSLAEGFGFAFLEPWTAARPLFGRKLPGLCRDFTAAGMDLRHLYQGLSVPVEWLDKKALREKISRAVAAGRRAVGLEADPAVVDRFAALADQPLPDFALLDESLQKQVIRRVLTEEADRRRLATINPFLTGFRQTVRPQVISHNRRVVRDHFSQAACGRRLMTAYQRAAENPVRHGIDKGRLLSRFFRPDCFSLLQWGEYDRC